MKEFFHKLKAIFIGDSWKTSCIGYLGAMASVFLPILYNGDLPTLSNCIAAASFAFVSRFAKDHDVTGTQIR